MHNADLLTSDPQMHSLICKEINRQKRSINLIASENYCSTAVYQSLGTPTQNKYSEGLPGKRYYGGNQIIDQIENLGKKRALELFGLDPEVWDVSMQCLSGCVANIVAYSAILEVGDKALAMNLSEGGHLSHGFKLGDKVISHTAKYYDWEHYGIDEDGFLDYNEMKKVNLHSYIYIHLSK